MIIAIIAAAAEEVTDGIGRFALTEANFDFGCAYSTQLEEPTNDKFFLMLSVDCENMAHLKTTGNAGRS